MKENSTFRWYYFKGALHSSLLSPVLTGHQITRTSDYDAVLNILKDSSYELVIADLNMEDKLDVSFLVLIKTIIPEVPVIIYTTVFSMESLKTAMKNKANNYILKGTDYTDITAAVKKADYYEKFKNTYVLAEDAKFEDVFKIRTKAVRLGNLAAEKYFDEIKDAPAISFTGEDVYRILTGSYAVESERKLKTNIKKGHSGATSPVRNKILFVDDEDTLRNLLGLEIKDHFLDQGLEVDIIHADTAEDGIEKYSRHKDAIIMSIIDMKMPLTNVDKKNELFAKSSGVEVLRQVKTYDMRCECIILTAFAFSSELCECYRLRAFDLCDKTRKELFFKTAIDAYHKSCINYERFNAAAYISLSYFRSAFAGAFVGRLLKLFKGYKDLSSQERLNIVEFEFLMDRVF